MTVTEMLRVHRDTWDMPTLAKFNPEILEHLVERYDVAFDMASYVVVFHKTEGRTERLDTQDVRVVVETLLSREALASISQEVTG